MPVGTSVRLKHEVCDFVDNKVIPEEAAWRTTHTPLQLPDLGY